MYPHFVSGFTFCGVDFWQLQQVNQQTINSAPDHQYKWWEETEFH